ncbi:Leucine-rich repeat typical subtype [Arabidopsis thaliana x Arabidopsis arenosa]|uniref:non-specific serine/threonine protein kinase n=1 Tax=Arabidopsis thaliana x Arabidopsis arenosa TaxID=1240361 RepID=A0A8T1YYY5_9BRAS|nr:Leucine-rich repeat typical subtype [Arabidopsis thaliana x Arabidopsis arenosa]
MKLSFSLFFNALMLLLQVCCVVFAQARFSNETDMQALLEFKSQVSENKREVLASWNHSSPLCNWIGVICGRRQERVISLNLGGFKFTGVISPSIGNLSFLRFLNLGDNSFGSTIPQEVGRLFRLQYLNMSYNLLEGRIPPSLSNCSRLSTVDLSSNQLGHGVPSELGSLSMLAILDLSKNNLTGNFPASLGNLTSLQKLDFAYNQMGGEIPDEVARLTQMVFFQIALNSFSGGFPPALYNISSLESLSLADNSFSGNLRADFGELLPNLIRLLLGTNQFTGVIPITLANISSLERFDISSNYLTGSIPSSFGKLRNLWWLGIRNNSLGYNSSIGLEFIGALANCTQLEYLDVGYNRLGGELPASIANLSTKLTSLFLGQNLISGTIPHDIGNLISLQELSLETNKLSGELPVSFGKLLNLQVVDLYSNAISGEIPSYFGNMTRLQKLHLNSNSFHGRIPQSLGRCRYLLDLWIDTNRLNGTIPREILQIPSLAYIDLSNNFLTGHFPEEVGKLELLVGLGASYNKLSGKIPQSIGGCLSMEFLYMQGNFFDGAIPDISRLVSLTNVDFSNNNLSGRIPRYLANLPLLRNLNLSMNKFEGRVPTTGVFRNATAVSVFGNKNICGGVREMQLKPCIVKASPRKRKPLSLRQKVASGIGIGVALLLLIIIVASLCWFMKRRKKNNASDGNPSDSTTLGMFHEKVSYEELHSATSGFSSTNLIGSGNFGNVFKGLLGHENKLVAVKVLNLLKHGATKSFMAECETFKGIRHRNLVKLITVCSSLDSEGNEFRALVYEFMPKGSLDMWLQPEDQERANEHSRSLTLAEKLNIAIDVASALEYLHVHCHDPVAHCDIKPSNVLLNDDLTAHVSDFGLARLLYKYDRESFLNQFSSAGVRGTIGYTAPEYGMGGQPSIQGDVYSFGILLLEMFTGKKPTDEPFAGDYNLHCYTQSVLSGCTSSGGSNAIDEWLRLVLQVGINCSEEYPRDRMRIAEAVRELISIRTKFFSSKTTITESPQDAPQSSPQEWMLNADMHTM